MNITKKDQSLKKLKKKEKKRKKLLNIEKYGDTKNFFCKYFNTFNYT